MVEIKAKRIEDHIFYGAIDENRKEVISFEYEKIEKYEGLYYCKRYDGTWDMYMKEWKKPSIKKALDQSSGYEIINHIDNWNFIARKNGKVGIIALNLTGKEKIRSVYRFGKASEIRKEEDGTIRLIKHQKNGDDLFGFYNDEKYGTFDPEYLSIEKRCFPLKDNLPSDGAKYVENKDLLWYSKRVNGDVVFGIKQFAWNGPKDKFILEDFLPCEYNNICFLDNNIIELTKKVDGKIQKGCICYSVYWNMLYNYGWVGRADFRKEIKIPCEYDSIKYEVMDEVLGEDFIKLYKDNKVKMLYVNWNKTAGYFRDSVHNREERYHSVVALGNGKFYDSIEKVSDRIFLGHRFHGCDILTTYETGEYNTSFHTLTGNYASVMKIEDLSFGSNAWIATLKNGGKQYISFKYVNGRRSDLIKSPIVKDIDFVAYTNNEKIAMIMESNNGEKSIYTPDYKLVVENVLNVKHHDVLYFYEVQNKSCKKQIYDDNNKFMFECNLDDIVSTVNYSNRVFSIQNFHNDHVKLKLCKEFDNEYDKEKYETFKMVLEGHTFKHFDAYPYDKPYSFHKHFICDYIILYEDGQKQRRLTDINFSTGEVRYICNGNFRLESFNKDYTRTIISLHNDDPLGSNRLFAVIDNKDGNLVIPFNYSNISYNKENNTFICTKEHIEMVEECHGKTVSEDIEIDTDGFEVINENIKSDVKVKQKTDKKN